MQSRRSSRGSLSDHGDAISHDFSFQPLSPRAHNCTAETVVKAGSVAKEVGLRKKEEFTRAVALGLMDSLRKSKS